VAGALGEREPRGEGVGEGVCSARAPVPEGRTLRVALAEPVDVFDSLALRVAEARALRVRVALTEPGGRPPRLGALDPAALALSLARWALPAAPVPLLRAKVAAVLEARRRERKALLAQ
jgi:hypothetical protein